MVKAQSVMISTIAIQSSASFFQNKCKLAARALLCYFFLPASSIEGNLTLAQPTSFHCGFVLLMAVVVKAIPEAIASNVLASVLSPVCNWSFSSSFNIVTLISFR